MKQYAPEKRVELTQQAQRLLFAELPWIPIHMHSSGTAWRPDLMTGWPAKKGIMFQPGNATYMSIDRIWLANTPDAEKWIKTQKK